MISANRGCPAPSLTNHSSQNLSNHVIEQLNAICEVRQSDSSILTQFGTPWYLGILCRSMYLVWEELGIEIPGYPANSSLKSSADGGKLPSRIMTTLIRWAARISRYYCSSRPKSWVADGPQPLSTVPSFTLSSRICLTSLLSPFGNQEFPACHALCSIVGIRWGSSTSSLTIPFSSNSGAVTAARLYKIPITGLVPGSSIHQSARLIVAPRLIVTLEENSKTLV